MNTALRLGGFAGLLAVAFAAAALAGNAVDPDPVRGDDGHSGTTEPAHGSAAAGHDEPQHASTDAAPVRGLAVAEGRYALRLGETELTSTRPRRLSFRIVDRRDDPVTDFDLEHERRMHLIVVRRDATEFQHLHPTMDDEGTWSAPVRLDTPGSYRVFADFSVGGRPQTLGADLAVDGDADYRELPESRPLADAGAGYTVRLDHDPIRAGDPGELAFTVHKDGRAVRTEPYLGAGGHLVALRDRDLAFLHTHPAEHSSAVEEHSDATAFESTFPSAGRYRLFLQFKHEGRVRTAAFTVEVQP